MRGRTVLCAVVMAATLAPAASAQRRSSVQLVGGLHVGAPTQASLAVGATFGRRARELDAPFVVVEPGLKGGRVSLGYVRVGQLGSGGSVRVSALRTWRQAGPRTYVGAEVQGMLVALLGARVGVLRTVDAGMGRTMVVGNFSIGL